MPGTGKIPRAVYERELLRLQAEFVKLQEWVRAEGPARAARSSGSPST